MVSAVCCIATWAIPRPAAADGGTEIVFASGPDDTGTVQRIVDAFNEAHRGKIHVTWRPMDRESEVHRADLTKELSSGTGNIDLLASDVIWTAELAKKDYVVDLTHRFDDAYERDDLLAPALGSATYRLRVWGVPWYTDAGMLFYRKDMLAAGGFDQPPATWDELASMARRVQEMTGTLHGFVFQGARYEGGTVNAAEYIWSAGGEMMTGQITTTGLVVTRVAETDAIRIRSKEAARGFDVARQLVTDGVAPAEVVDFKEKEALDAFVSGNAVFLRSWPYAFGVLRKAGLTADQVGIATLPTASKGGRSLSCLGGWNLMINARSSEAEQDAAWTLIRYLTDEAQQRLQAREAGLLPILVELYEDPELVRAVPAMRLGKQVFDSNLRSRPKSPFYSEMSSSIAGAFHRTLKGELTGAEAVKLLDQELRAISIRNR
jgi:multiple sugar transport system substrate-binding protein